MNCKKLCPITLPSIKDGHHDKKYKFLQLLINVSISVKTS